MVPTNADLSLPNFQPTVLHAIRGPLGGAIQTVPRAELTAVVAVLESTGIVEIRTDCQYVVVVHPSHRLNNKQSFTICMTCSAWAVQAPNKLTKPSESPTTAGKTSIRRMLEGHPPSYDVTSFPRPWGIAHLTEYI